MIDRPETAPGHTTNVPIPTPLGARMLGEGPIRVVPLPDAEPPQEISGLAGEYIGLSLAGGLVLGVIAGALLPRATGRKMAAGTSVAAGLLGRLALRRSAPQSGQAPADKATSPTGDALVSLLLAMAAKKLRKP